jgi:tetratricopeptide (TPR) repeat protein
MAIKPDHALFHLNRGELKRVKGDLDGALNDYNRTIELKPDSFIAFNNRGLVKRAKGDLDGALEDFNKAIELKPDLGSAYSNRALVKKSKGDLIGAEADSEKALELKPESAETCHQRGEKRLTQQDWDGALGHFNRAIELNPNYAEAYGSRGVVKWNKKDLDGALADLNKAIKLIPSWHSLKEIRGFVTKDLRELKSGTELKQKANTKKIPRTENALALRTDFSDEATWQMLCEAIQNPENSSDDFTADVDFVSDRAFEGLTAKQLPSFLSDDSQSFAFIIDKIALSNSEHPILVVDLQDEPGRTFRVISSELWTVENNLSIANMGFDEFADAVDKDGVFRGFPDK